jgi:hypothetical protein
MHKGKQTQCSKHVKVGYQHMPPPLFFSKALLAEKYLYN